MAAAEIRVEKAMRHPRERVFDAFVDPTRVGEWTRVTVTFEAEGDGCRVVLIHDLAAEWAAYADRTVFGWTTILDGLSRVMQE